MNYHYIAEAGRCYASPIMRFLQLYCVVLMS